MNPLPPLSALRAFEAFARLGRMTLAGEELCVTHGAVSRQVRSLEATMGLRLTTGPRHQLKLTEAGELLAASLTQAFDQIRTTVASLHPTTELHLSCIGTLAIRWLIPRLSAFHQLHPQIRVRVTESYAPVDFTRDRFDAATYFVQHFADALEVEIDAFQFAQRNFTTRLVARDAGRFFENDAAILGVRFEDEADPAKGSISYVSPLAQALMGKATGHTVLAGAGEAEITAIT